MGLESGTYISDLVATNPTGGDDKSKGDDHIRLLKSTIKATFPNINGAVTASPAELNLLDGVTASTAELNILDGVTANVAELNILEGATLTTTELNYVTGVTSAIQTQIDSKGAHAGQMWTGAHDFSGASGVTLPAATSIGSVDATEISYVNGVTSAIQTQINNLDTAKADISGETYSGTHNFTGATINVPTATAGASGSRAASLDYVIATSFSSALPGQTGNSGKFLTTDGTNASWSVLPATQHLHVREEQATGTHGGSLVVGWQTRTLNTVVSNTIPSASLGSNKITLPAGTYQVFAESPLYGGGVTRMRLRLYNVTDDSIELIGVSEATPGQGGPVLLSGRITLDDQKELRLDLYSSLDRATTGLGLATGDGSAEIYSTVEITKVDY